MTPEWIAAIVGAVGAVTGFVVGLRKYTESQRQKRAEYFLDLWRRFRDSPEYRKVVLSLEKERSESKELTLDEKLEFLGFHDQIALLLNSNLIAPQVAHYMFGCYAIKFWDRYEKDTDLQLVEGEDAKYWAVFNDFVTRMRGMRDPYDREKFRF